MTTPPRTIQELEALNLGDLPVLEVVARETVPYRIDRQWGPFDELGLRAIDDLWFPESSKERALVFSASEIALPDGFESIAIPAPIALERAFFHIQEISMTVINPKSPVEGVSELQCGVFEAVRGAEGEEIRLSRAELAAVLGMLSSGKKRAANPLVKARNLLRDGSLFEAYYLARRCREQGKGDVKLAWFLELMSLSFLGLPEESLAAYEEYPERGSSGPHAMLLAARFRLLLRQMNEARTILHTLTFNEELGALAACELARSYNMSGDFSRAIDAASLAISKDGSYAEAYLVRGVAHRGIAYPSGEEDGLKEALKNFEVVAKRSGFGAAEASFHAGTVFGRLGALDEAERSLRQSLFQRDRFSARDALVRVLCAGGESCEAQDELSVLEKLAPTLSQKLKADVAEHLTPSAVHKPTPAEAGVVADLWSGDFTAAREAASKVVDSWKLPISRTADDFAVLDDFINRFAPAGDFPSTGEWGALGRADSATVARVLAIYLGDLLVTLGGAAWAETSGDRLTVQLSKDGNQVPIEAFVRERIVLGAAGDNFSGLESLVSDLRSAEEIIKAPPLPNWWGVASAADRAEYSEAAAHGAKRLSQLGAKLTGGLADLEEVDRIVDMCFEPGGSVKSGMEETLAESADQFVIESALYVGSIVTGIVPAEWCSHAQPEGISLFHPGTGRIFPVAKMQRRVFLSTAADFGARMSSVAFGVAAAAVQEGIRTGLYRDVAQVRDALVALIPSMREFPEVELAGVAQSLFGDR